MLADFPRVRYVGGAGMERSRAGKDVVDLWGARARWLDLSGLGGAWRASICCRSVGAKRASRGLRCRPLASYKFRALSRSLPCPCCASHNRTWWRATAPPQSLCCAGRCCARAWSCWRRACTPQSSLTRLVPQRTRRWRCALLFIWCCCFAAAAFLATRVVVLIRLHWLAAAWCAAALLDLRASWGTPASAGIAAASPSAWPLREPK